MNTPVGSAPNDDVVIARALFDSKDKGQTYKQALDALHGVNSHASNLWKDYYLDHHERLDLLVSRLSDQPISAKKPFAPSFRLQPTSRAHGGSSKTPEPTGRKTFNSITAPSQTQDVPNLLPPHASIIVPDVPSRSPTPPTLIIAGNRGNKYTEEDRSFFLKFISWELKNDPSLSKKELCEKLAEKAPHHSATSWAGHWHSRHDIADKILAAAEARLESDGSDSDADADGEHEYSAEEIIDSDEEDAASANLIGSEYGDLDDDTEEDVKEMALPGAAPRPADFRVLARYIASISDWDALTAVANLRQFSDKHPQKSARAWAELYSDNDEGWCSCPIFHFS
ncbi:hypothetical protein SERLADRAFT_345204 [Serpula lacrymans var. lacrymans S7.9]|uniref:Uncharacterized protein n=1 Tax=Serpula lacrymans var. lacrymans (strain S7.9) TaxID=578457 RepID=F8NFV3_SERL9|nr:uncharacterized protein SERLADRAFT_345204 [Serpula lacrymans var. lacrymans S7.9]EGO30923.1 hypothetical protein SERLADRAFT_345204 [Serpula lacrymans var. lacrymans S7.9]